MTAKPSEPAGLTKQQEAMLEANMGCVLVFLGVFAAVFTSLCAFFFVMAYFDNAAQHRLNAATDQVDAVVLSSEVLRLSGGPASSSTPSGGGGHVPRVRFAYELGGERHESDRLWPVDETFKDSSAASAHTQRYAAGDAVRAWVDPADPGGAFLEKRWSSTPFVAMLASLGMIGLIVAGLTWLVGWRWFAQATVCSLGLALFIAAAAFWTAWWWHASVPSASRPSWMPWAWGLGAAGPMLVLAAWLKARALHGRLAAARSLAGADSL